jgi:hypothetical protein
MFTRLVRGGNRGDARTGRQCVGNVQVTVLVCLGIVLGRTLLIQQQVFNVPNDPTLLIQIDALLSALDTPRNRTTPTTSNGGNLTVSYNLKVSSPPLTNQSLLCDECLQIVQRAPRIKLAKTASRNTTSPALDEYHRLRRERRHPFQGAVDAHGRSGFQYDVTSLRRNPPSFVESFPNLTAECLRRDDEYYALQRLRIHSPSPEQSITATQNRNRLLRREYFASSTVASHFITSCRPFDRPGLISVTASLLRPTLPTPLSMRSTSSTMVRNSTTIYGRRYAPFGLRYMSCTTRILTGSIMALKICGLWLKICVCIWKVTRFEPLPTEASATHRRWATSPAAVHSYHRTKYLCIWAVVLLVPQMFKHCSTPVDQGTHSIRPR